MSMPESIITWKGDTPMISGEWVAWFYISYGLPPEMIVEAFHNAFPAGSDDLKDLLCRTYLERKDASDC